MLKAGMEGTENSVFFLGGWFERGQTQDQPSSMPETHHTSAPVNGNLPGMGDAIMRSRH